jgi:hypothetical protein
MFYIPVGPYALFFELDTLRDWEYKFITKYAKLGTIKTLETTADASTMDLL